MHEEGGGAATLLTFAQYALKISPRARISIADLKSCFDEILSFKFASEEF